MSEIPSIEVLLSKYFKEDADRMLNKHPELVTQLLPICLTNTAPMCWRAAWVIHSAMVDNDKRVSPFIDPILKVLSDKKDGHQRELIRLLIRMELSEDQASVLYDECVTIWESVKKQSSVRQIAFQFMATMVETYPELIHEIDAVTQAQHLNSLSPGIRVGVQKLIRSLERFR